MTIPLAIAGLAGGVIDAISGNANAQSARDAFKSRYQDTVRDMRKAGLNPALAYGQGGGNPQTHDRPLAGEQAAKAGQMVSTAAQARANMELTNAQRDLLLAQKDDIIARTKAEAQSAYAKSQSDTLRYQGESQQFDARMKSEAAKYAADLFAPDSAKAALRGQELENKIRGLSLPELQAMANYYKGAGRYEPYANALVRMIQGFIPRLNIGGDRTINPTTIIRGK